MQYYKIHYKIYNYIICIFKKFYQCRITHNIENAYNKSNYAIFIIIDFKEYSSKSFIKLQQPRYKKIK